MTSPDNIPPCTIVSQNARGTKSGNRLDHCIASMSARGADVVLLQEHGLHVEDKSRLTRICRRYGYLAFAAFIPRTKTHGGTAVLIKWQTFGLRPAQELRKTQGLDGGVICVHMPVKEGQPPTSFASIYVPVRATTRKRFLSGLRHMKVITRNTIVGADRNTVSDVSLDVRYPVGSRTAYQNQHASMWDRLMAGLGLRDVCLGRSKEVLSVNILASAQPYTLALTACSVLAKHRHTNGTPSTRSMHLTPLGPRTT